MGSISEHRLHVFHTKNQFAFFSHPDYTVGFGITPNRPLKWSLKRVADYTAGRELHPALKNYFILLQELL